jgi:lipopolysaccharide transport system ATP-binding protein
MLLSPIENLTRLRKLSRFGDEEQDDIVWALRDVSFDVGHGEVLGIIGRNGAGKSTLLKILSRITRPTTGRAAIQGRVGSLLEVGTGFHPELTGRDNIFLNGSILGMDRAYVRRRFDEIVEFAGVEKFIDTPVKRYSSGMYLRLAFAVAAHLEPEVLVVDEVLAVGDAEFQRRCLGRMSQTAKEGRTVLFVSHNLAAVLSLCDRGLLLNGGEVCYLGTAEKAVATYSSLNAAAASGSVAFEDGSGRRHGPRDHASLIRLSLLDKNHQLTDVLEMGQPAYFQITADFMHPGDNFEIGIGISNLYDVSLQYFVSPWEGFQSVPTAGIHTVEVEIPSVHLFPGEYHVVAWIKIQGGHFDDGVHEALRFSVMEGSVTAHYSYFGRYSHNTEVYSPSVWRFTSALRSHV